MRGLRVSKRFYASMDCQMESSNSNKKADLSSCKCTAPSGDYFQMNWKDELTHNRPRVVDNGHLHSADNLVVAMVTVPSRKFNMIVYHIAF